MGKGRLLLLAAVALVVLAVGVLWSGTALTPEDGEAPIGSPGPRPDAARPTPLFGAGEAVSPEAPVALAERSAQPAEVVSPPAAMTPRDAEERQVATLADALVRPLTAAREAAAVESPVAPLAAVDAAQSLAAAPEAAAPEVAAVAPDIAIFNEPRPPVAPLSGGAPAGGAGPAAVEMVPRPAFDEPAAAAEAAFATIVAPPAAEEAVALATVAPAAGAPDASAPDPGAPAVGGYAVQFSSFRNADSAKGERDRLTARLSDVIGDTELSVVRADLGQRGVFFRVITAGLPDRQMAADLCARAKARDQDCFVLQR